MSGTGWGEFYIRAAVAHDICARVAYRGDRSRRRPKKWSTRSCRAMGGDGGAIALDAEGNIAMPFNTPGMYRGWIKPDGSRGTAVFPTPESPGKADGQRRAARRLEPPLGIDPFSYAGLGRCFEISHAPTPHTKAVARIVARIVAPRPGSGCVRMMNSVSAADSRPTYYQQIHM